jgi:hypothetical protein
MYLLVEENPNCAADERMFADAGTDRPVLQAQVDSPRGNTGWCDVAAVDEGGRFGVARARQVEDSAAGTAWLVTGGAWGLRLRPAGAGAWSLTDSAQWGVPFLVLDESAVRFGETS